jgi:putative transposase
VKTAIRAPNQNSYAERFVQTIKTECLDHFIVLGEKHLRYIIDEYLIYYHEERPHLALGNLPPGMTNAPVRVECLSIDDVVCQEQLGGLLKHYQRKAA